MSSTSPRSPVVRTARTPRLRPRQRFDCSIVSDENEETDISKLEDLLGLTWNVYAISALFDLQRDDVHLKLYSKKLREEIASALSRENVSYDAKLSVVEHMARSSEQSHPAIKIEVLARTVEQETETEKQIYMGVLLCWQAAPIKQDMQNSTKLPLLLCRGTNSCTDAVHTVIGRMFDCMVVALPANAEDLTWLVPIIIVSINRTDLPARSSEVRMEYTVPELPETDTIAVKFHMPNLQSFLKAIIPDDNSCLEEKHVEVFYDVLHEQMAMLSGIRLGLCTLHKVILPGVTITKNRMKVMNGDIMNCILLYLNEKALETFYAMNADA